VARPGNHGEQADHADGGRPPGDVVHLERNTTFVSAVPMRDHEVPSHILRYGTPTRRGVRSSYRRDIRPFPVSG